MKIAQRTIPIGWKKEKISAIGEVVSGATPKTSEPSYWDGSLAWVTPKDLSRLNSAYIDSSERKITDAGFESCSAAKIPANSLIMSSRAPIGYLAINRVTATTNQGCKSIIPKSTVSTEYLYYYLNQNIDDVKRLGSGSTFAEVGKSAVESVEILVPPIIEQKKIAEILLAIDDEIQKTDEIVSATEKLKGGLMQGLFTKGIGHTKFKETKIGTLPEEWDVVKLGDYVDIRSGDTPTAFDFKVDGSIPFYKVEDMNQSEKYLLSTRYHFESYAKPLMPKGMIVFPKRGASIHTNKVRILSEDSYFDTNVMGLTTKYGLCNDYLYYLLIHIGLSQFADTTSIPQINNKHIEPLEIPLPKYEEQQDIAKMFSLLDEKIVVNKAIQKNLLILKKGLMQDLLTGKVRTEKYEHAG